MSTVLLLKITLGNDAMSTGEDVAAALVKAAKAIARDYGGSDLSEMTEGDLDDAYGPVIDSNGNKVGDWKVVK